MTMHLMAQVWDLELPAREKFILLAYADDADVWPPEVLNVALLSQKTGYPSAEVEQVLRQLSANTTLLHEPG
jgi:hypothetical protein